MNLLYYRKIMSAILFRKLRSLAKIRRNISVLACRMDQKTQAVEEAEKVFSDNPYFAKYADKIKKLSANEIQDKLKEIEETKKQFNSTIIQDAKNSVNSNRTYQELLKPKEKKDGASVKLGGRKEVKLDDIMNVELLEANVKSREELETIWMTYHKEEIAAKNTEGVENYLISGIITGDKYRQLQAHSKQYPVFLLPLPRDQGYEFFLVQFHLNEVHITSLLAFQVHKENAPECLKLVHFTEYTGKYNTVLMRGEFNRTVLNQLEVNCLINQLQLFYCTEADSSSAKVLEKFNKNPDTFDHMEIIRQIEQLQM